MTAARGAEGDFLSLQRRVLELCQENAPAVVRVKAAYRPETEGEKPQVIIGTGFFISKEGHVLTNASIVNRPDRVWVEHKGLAYAATVVGEDVATNLALLQLETKPTSFNFLHLADSSELPPTGTFVLRLSAPLEFEPTPHLGLISGSESRFANRFFPCAYLRCNIPAGPGDGGAAYLDLTGKLVGIQVGSLPDIGSTYLLPARAALRIRDDLLFGGKVTYGWIGFEIREDRTVLAGNRLILSLVMPGTPAETAGMMPGDVLLQIGDYPIRNIEDLRNAMFYTRVGQYVRVRVQRDDQPLDFNIRLANRPETEPLEVPVEAGPTAAETSPTSPEPATAPGAAAEDAAPPGGAETLPAPAEAPAPPAAAAEGP